MLRNILFFLVVTSALFFMYATVYVVSARAFMYTVPFWYGWLLLPSVLFSLTFYAVRQTHHRLVSYFFILMASGAGTLFLLLCASLVYELIRLGVGDQPQLLAGMLSAATLVALYALWNGFRIVTRTYRIALPHLTTPKRVIHLSDLHIGTVRQQAYLEEVVSRCNELEPDLVLISGDLFDGSLPNYEGTMQPLNALSAPCYLSLGNHELYEGYDVVRDVMSTTTVVILEDRAIEACGLTIIGVNYQQNASKTWLGDVLDSISQHESINHTKPTILLNHEPIGWEDARSRGIDLMLSGHTHNGQMIPLNFLIKLFYTQAIGLYEKDSQYVHVSPGTGTWGPPMRLGSHNQITLFELVPVETQESGEVV